MLSKEKKNLSMRKIYDDTRPSILVLLAPIDRASLYLSLRGKRKIAEQERVEKGRWGADTKVYAATKF